MKEKALRRRQDLLESYERNEARPGKRSDDQRLEKERLLEGEVAAQHETLKRLQQQASGDGTRAAAAEARCQELEALVGAGEAAKAELQRCLERAEEALRVANTTGAAVPGTAKIVHLVANPSVRQFNAGMLTCVLVFDIFPSAAMAI